MIALAHGVRSCRRGVWMFDLIDLGLDRAVEVHFSVFDHDRDGSLELAQS